MLKKQKRDVLILLLISLISLVFLSTTISNLQLLRGLPVNQAGESFQPIKPSTGTSFLDISTVSKARGVLAFLFMTLAALFLGRLIFLIPKKLSLLNWFTKIAIPILGLITLLVLINHSAPSSNVPAPAESTSIVESPVLPVPIVQLRDPPDVFRWVIIFVILLVMVVIIFYMVKRQPQGRIEKDQLLNEAEKAMTLLNAGEDFKNVIIRCYVQMSQILKENREMERCSYMTVREFEKLVNENGIPTEPVHQLCSLFEKVRYGEYRVRPTDERVGIESLNEIIHYCRMEEER